MRKSYIMIYSPTLATRAQVTALLDRLDPNGDWHAPFASAIFFTSSHSAQEFAGYVEKEFGVGPGKLFLISEIGTDKQGRLKDRGWRVLNNPDNPRAT